MAAERTPGEEAMAAVSQSIAYNRGVKATKLAQVFEGLGYGSEVVARLPHRGWLMAAKLAGTRIPSQLTKDLVLEMLRVRENPPCGS